MKVLAFGEVLWDIYPTERFIGGAPFNFAGHLSIQKNESYILSAVGNDPLAADTIKAIKALNVAADYVSVRTDRPTGSCTVTLDGNGIPSYDLKNDVAYDYIVTDGINADDFDAIYFGTLALRNGHNRRSLADLLKTAGRTIKFCDLNIRKPYFSGEVIRSCIENADIIKISDEELPTVLKEGYGKSSDGPESTARFIAEQNGNLKIVVITLGSKGSMAYDVKKDSFFFCGVGNVEVVSTVGAGDSFSASFLSEYFKGNSVSDCLRFASKVSDFVVSHTAAVPEYDPEKIKENILSE